MRSTCQRTDKNTFFKGSCSLFLAFLTFGSCEEQIICCIYTENGFGVALRDVDTLKFGPAAVLRGRHGVDHTSVIHM